MTFAHPGELSRRETRSSRLLLLWDAEDLSLTPRTGQLETFVSETGASVVPGTIVANGGIVQAGQTQPRFCSVDTDNDGVGGEVMLALESLQAQENVIENSSLSADAVSYTSTGTLTRQVSSPEAMIGSTFGRVVHTGATGSGVQVTTRAGSRITALLNDHWETVWINPAASLVGRSLQLLVEFYDAGSVVVGSVQTVFPITRTGWQRLQRYWPLTAMPGTTVTIRPRLLSMDASAYQFDFVGWTVVRAQSHGALPILTSTTKLSRGYQRFRFEMNLIKRSISVLVRCMPTTFGQDQVFSTMTNVWSLGISTTLGQIGLQLFSGGFRSTSAYGGNSVVSDRTVPAGFLWPAEVLTQFYEDGSVQTHLRNRNGLLVGSSARSGSLVALQPNAMLRISDWADHFYLGSGQAYASPGNFFFRRVKMAEGTPDLTAMDGLN